MIYFAVLTISVIMTFARYNFIQVAGLMNLPVYEVEFLEQVPVLHGYNLLGLLAMPLLTILGLLVYSRRYLQPADMR